MIVLVSLVGLGVVGAAQSANPHPRAAHLSVARAQLAGTSAGDYVLFAGGYVINPEGDTDSDVVDVYHAPSASWSVAHLSTGRGVMCGVSIDVPNAPPMAFFAGGKHENKGPQNVTNRTDAVDVFDATTGQWQLLQLSVARSMVACVASAAGNVYFAGGEYDEDRSNPAAQECSDVIDVYNVHTSTWHVRKLSQPRKKLAAATIGTKLIFAGGYLSGVGSVTTVEILEETTGEWTFAKLSTSRFRHQAASIGTLAMFLSGQGCDWTCKTADVLDVPTGTWTVENMTGGRYEFSAVVVAGTHVVVAGGKMPRQWNPSVVDVFDLATRSWSNTIAAALVSPRFFLAGAEVPGTGAAMFAGGSSLVKGEGVLSSVEVVQLKSR